MHIKRIYITCPVRSITEAEKTFLDSYVAGLEKEGYQVHYPPRDTPQEDTHGIHICRCNNNAIVQADEVHIYWNPTSQGSKFDFGMVFALNKPVLLINRSEVKPTDHKSFENVLIALDDNYRQK
ncbi:MAG: nucleoside 2-deoxyribosyltransferase [Candidatus Komeilibacteria bacterium]